MSAAPTLSTHDRQLSGVRPLPDDLFAPQFLAFAAIAGARGTSALTASDLADRPELVGWLDQVRAAYTNDTLSADQQHLMASLREWSWDPAHAEWLHALTEHAALLGDQGCDMRRDDVACAAHMVWARAQQLAWDSLTAERRTLLSDLPGWAPATNADRLVAGDLPGLRALCFDASAETAALARRTCDLPVQTVAAMARSGSESAKPLNDLLALAASDVVDARGRHLAAAVAMLPTIGDTQAAAAFLGEHLEVFVAGHFDVNFLTELDEEAAAAVAIAYRRFHGAADAPVATPTAGGGLAAVSGAGTGVGGLGTAVGAWDATWRRETLGDLRVAAPTTPAKAAAALHPLTHRHIASLRLSTRTRNVLTREGLERLGDLLAIEDPEELLRLRGFGMTCLNDLRQRMVEVGAVPLF